MIHFQCPDCSKMYSVDSKHEGREIKCSMCGEENVITRYDASDTPELPKIITRQHNRAVDAPKRSEDASQFAIDTSATRFKKKYTIRDDESYDADEDNGGNTLGEKVIGWVIFAVLFGGYVLIQQGLKSPGPDSFPFLIGVAWVVQVLLLVAIYAAFFSIPAMLIGAISRDSTIMGGLKMALLWGTIVGCFSSPIFYLTGDPTETGWPPYVNSRIIGDAELYRKRHSCSVCGTSNCLHDEHWAGTPGEFWWELEKAEE